MAPPRRLACGHCGTANVVTSCRCGRPFVLTRAHIEKRRRGFEEDPLREMPRQLESPDCDLCVAKELQLDPREVLTAGVRQRTCPACHREFLSEHGL